MTAITIDTYALVTSLKEAGFEEPQAKAAVDMVAKFVDTSRQQIEHDHKLDDVATKRDLKELELTLNNKISDSKTETIKWVAAIVVGTGVAQIFAIIGVLKLLGKI
jgi:hypothetical protein